MSFEIDVTVPMGAKTLTIEMHGGDGPVALIGPNGAGKTTLLRAIAGANTPTRGSIVVGDEVLFRAGEIDRPIERRGVGYVPQGFGLFEHLSVLENVAFGLTTGPHRLPASERTTRAREMLDELEIAHLTDRRPRRLSGGEQQRVALARALVLEPNLLLLDEPLAALDATARRTVRDFLTRRLRAFGRPSIVVTHDVRDVVALDATVWAIADGNVVQHGSLDDLRADPATDFVAEFVAG